MTPDSSRFWAADAYKPGQPQPSFDKQPLRDYLDAERRAGRWNGEAPPPPLPASVVEATSKRYLEAYRRITGAELKIRRSRLMTLTVREMMSSRSRTSSSNYFLNSTPEHLETLGVDPTRSAPAQSLARAACSAKVHAPDRATKP